MAPVIQHRRRLKDRYRQQAGSYRLRASNGRVETLDDGALSKKLSIFCQQHAV
jgi:hypothetical protein